MWLGVFVCVRALGAACSCRVECSETAPEEAPRPNCSKCNPVAAKAPRPVNSIGRGPKGFGKAHSCIYNVELSGHIYTSAVASLWAIR